MRSLPSGFTIEAIGDVYRQDPGIYALRFTKAIPRHSAGGGGGPARAAMSV